MCIYSKNNPAKCRPDPIWYDGASGFFSVETWRVLPQQEEQEDE